MNIEQSTKVFIGLMHAALGMEVRKAFRSGHLSTEYGPLASALRRSISIIGRPEDEQRQAERLLGAEFLATFRKADPQLFEFTDEKEKERIFAIVMTTMQLEHNRAGVAKAIEEARKGDGWKPPSYLDWLKCFARRVH